MHTVNLAEAEQQLEQLLNAVAYGEEVIIRGPNGRTFRIVPVETSATRPRFGSARGLIEIGEDFDEPLEDFKEYMP
jgi:antitoxin (DNA-binding transcriptional repressor) of toxin-antitoxin stability system